MDPFAGALVAGFGFLIIMMTVLPSILMLVSLVYVALRVRDAKAEHPDPELGLKTAYWLLYTIGIIIAHFGLTVLASHALQLLEITGPAMHGGGNRFGGMPFANANDSWSPASRTGWALVLAGGAIALAFYLIGTLGTRDREWPTVRRVFTGSRIAIAGLVVAFTFLFVMQFQKDIPPGGIYETALASLAIWLPSMAIHVFLFRWGGTPAYHVPLEVRGERRRPTRYTEEDEIPEVAPDRGEAGTPEPRRRTREVDDERTDDGNDETPRRRRPRDDD